MRILDLKNRDPEAPGIDGALLGTWVSRTLALGIYLQRVSA